MYAIGKAITIVLIQTHAKTSKGIPTKMEMEPSSG